MFKLNRLFTKHSLILILIMSVFVICGTNIGCNLFTWEKLIVDCSIGINDTYYNEEYIAITFSLPPETSTVDNNIQLLADKTIIQTDKFWKDSILYLKPHVSWQKGQKYQLTFDDKVHIIDGRTYSVYLQRFFYFGEKEMYLELHEYNFDSNILEYHFNKAVNIVSFIDSFSLTPYTEHTINFSSGNTIVTVVPKKKWQTNTTYKWIITNILAADGYLMEKEYSDTFTPHEDIVQPSILTICPVTVEEPENIWHTHSQLDEILTESQAIGFIFSKPMNFSSISSGITFSPSINGYFIQENDTHFIFIPLENYKINKRYQITIPSTITDLSDLNLFEDQYSFFTSASKFLTISSILFDENLINIDTEIIDYEKNPLDPLNIIIEIAIEFSSSIPPENRKASADSVSLMSIFPTSAKNPKLLSTRWNPSGIQLIQTWQDFTLSTQLSNYYELKIKGGNSTIVNEFGEYLEEDLCIVFKVL